MNGLPLWWDDPLFEEAFRDAALAATAAPDGHGLPAALGCLDDVPGNRHLQLSLYLAEVVNALGAIADGWEPRDRWHEGDVAQVWASAAIESAVDRIREQLDDRPERLTAVLAAVDDSYGPPAVLPRWRVVLRNTIETFWVPASAARLVGPANHGAVDLLRIVSLLDGVDPPELRPAHAVDIPLIELLAPGAAVVLVDWLAGLAPTLGELDTAHAYIRAATLGGEEPF